MGFRFLRRSPANNLEHIQTLLLEMLAHDRHGFDLAMAALLAGADPDVIGPELRDTDQKVNEGEREIRRELIVHASVHGVYHVPAILVYMSVVKDVERVGDYAKNIWDIASQRRDLAEAPEAEEIRGIAARLSEMISETGKAFAADDVDAARRLLAEGDRLQDDFDERVTALITAEQPTRNDAVFAVLHRFFKRVVSHLMNVLSAVTMPVDQLDYFDEPKSPSAG
ncbi:MAG: PhoU domain-containing protein [Dehalococcoidia bacterium]